jgi:hypothetical protein
MGMLDGLIEQLEQSPTVARTMEQFNSVKNILIATVNRFDARFQQAENLAIAQSEALVRIEQKIDRLIFINQFSSDMKPAADDGLLAMSLASESTEAMGGVMGSE